MSTFKLTTRMSDLYRSSVSLLHLKFLYGVQYENHPKKTQRIFTKTRGMYCRQISITDVKDKLSLLIL